MTSRPLSGFWALDRATLTGVRLRYAWALCVAGCCLCVVQSVDEWLPRVSLKVGFF